MGYTKNVINVVNFIRSEDWREDPEELYQTFINQLELSKSYPMPYTFLMLYDAMIKPAYFELLLANNDPNMEVGLWLELSKEAVERAGFPWHEEHNWTWHVNPGMLLGYEPCDREKIIDELMERFKSIFGYYPASVGSWIIDTHSINYMKEKYGIKAVCICREQYGTDGYTLWGGYCWGGNGIHSAMYFVKKGTEERVKGNLISVTAEGENGLKIDWELDGTKAVCVCDEEKIRFEFSDHSFDMLFQYNDLRDSSIKKIGKNTVIYEHKTAKYGIKLSCEVKAEKKGYRISPDAKHVEINFLRF